MTLALIQRPDLVARVASPGLPRTRLVVAAAGFGKTALLSELQSAEPDALILDEATPSILSALPHDERLVFAASRSTAGLGIAAAVAAGTMAVFGERDLAFTTEDAAALASMLGVEAEPAGVADLIHRTEGWPVAVSLMLRQVKETPGPWLTATALLDEYVDEVVLADVPSSVRFDLRLMAVPEVATARLYGAAGGTTPFSRLLAMRPLLGPLPGREGAYRFHGLMRRYLINAWEGPDRVARTRAVRAVADQLCKDERYVEAAPLAIEAGDETLAGDVVQAGARRFVADGRISEAIRWMDAIGQDGIGGSGEAEVFGRTARMLAARSPAELAVLVTAAKSCQTNARGAERADLRLRYQIMLAELLVAPDMVSRAGIEELVADAADEDLVVWSEALGLLCLNLTASGNPSAARDASRRAEGVLRRNRSWYALSYMAAAVADAYRLRGRPDEAHLELQRFRNACDEPHLPAAAFVALSEAEGASLANDAALLWTPLADARSVLAVLSSSRARYRCDVLAALSGDAEALDNLSVADPPPGSPILAAQAARAGVWMPLPSKGAPHLSGSDPAISVLMRQNDELRVGKVGSASARHAEALATAARMNGVPEEEAFAYLTKAGLLARTDPVGSLRLIRETAEEHLARGVARPFLTSHEWLSAQFAVEHRAELTNLLSLNGDAGRGQGTAQTAEPTEDLLTPKEGQVLRILANGGSNQQVADDLYVSLATAKWHVRNILGKLDVPNRTSAVARARELGLVP